MMLNKLLTRYLFTNISKVPKNITQSIQIQDVNQPIQTAIQNRLKQLQYKHKQAQDLIDLKIKFPIKLYGTNDKCQQRFSYLFNRIMGYYRISKSSMNDYLLKMYKGTLFSLADRNSQYMSQYLQQNFKNKILQAIDNAKSLNFNIKVQQNSDYLNRVPQSLQIIDSIMIRGLSMDRQKNNPPSDYVRYTQGDQVGLITYTPKHLTYDNSQFVDPRKNKNVYQGYDRMLLRVLVRIKSPLRLTIPELQVQNDVYTWEHLVIFQNEMVAAKPLESGYKIQTYLQWLGKYRFGNWRIVDIDNFMKGNSPFGKHQKQVQIDPVFKGTKFDKSSTIDIRMI